jgi:hypothetical protein
MRPSRRTPARVRGLREATNEPKKPGASSGAKPSAREGTAIRPRLRSRGPPPTTSCCSARGSSAPPASSSSRTSGRLPGGVASVRERAASALPDRTSPPAGIAAFPPALEVADRARADDGFDTPTGTGGGAVTRREHNELARVGAGEGRIGPLGGSVAAPPATRGDGAAQAFHSVHEALAAAADHGSGEGEGRHPRGARSAPSAHPPARSGAGRPSRARRPDRRPPRNSRRSPRRRPARGGPSRWRGRDPRSDGLTEPPSAGRPGRSGRWSARAPARARPRARSAST